MKNKTDFSLSIEDFERYTSGNPDNPEYLFISFHGFGSNGMDMLQISYELCYSISDCLFISPNAPIKCEEFSSNSYKWFDLYDDFSKLFSSIKYCCEEVSIFVQKLSKKYNVPYEKIILSGFSQGAFVALYTSLMMRKNFLGIILYSGVYYLKHYSEIDIIKKILEIDETVSMNTELLFLHGRSDEVVDYKQSVDMYFYLLERGYNSNLLLIEGMNHSINISCIKSTKELIHRRLSYISW